MPKYSFDQKAFVIEDYDKAKPFSSFLPGLSGLMGIPMWTFYVNRGQAICSFGIQDKNSPIMEFSPASIAYKNVTSTGFRTFIKLGGGTGTKIYEPFQNAMPDDLAVRTMRIGENELAIEEIHKAHELKVEVSYFHMPNEDYAGLVRQVKVTNLSNSPRKIEMLDGMPEILPYGVENAQYKEIGNLVRSWMDVTNLEHIIPFYKVRSSIHDEAEVREIKRGHFYLSFSDDERLIAPIVDFELIFGPNTSLAYPDQFACMPLAQLSKLPQHCVNKVPCGFSGLEAELASGESRHVYTVIGHVSSVDKINEKSSQIISKEYIQRKRLEAIELTDKLTEDIASHTSVPLFDAYSRQSYLDNFLRGGYPFIFENGRDGFVQHLFSRKHGDLERDYNFFSIAPEYYSQGNGNFRDANQNRRSDILFNPKIGTYNIRTFFSLIQADGYNPLGIEGTTFVVREEQRDKLYAWVDQTVLEPEDSKDHLKTLCMKRFTPGRIISLIADNKVKLGVSQDDFLTGILSLASQGIEAAFREGYWSDHWTYNMDLIDSYLEIYPEHKEKLLFDDESYSFFDSPARVLPRSEKYVLNGSEIRQYGSLVPDEEKMERLGIGLNDTNWLKIEYGHGKIYCTSLFSKLVSLSLNKFATLDPLGMGIEMEANKPGWNDAMNGLPGLFGSGMSETVELKRMMKFMLEAATEAKGREIKLPEEMHEFFFRVAELGSHLLHGEIEQFNYWDQVSSARESYRERIRFGISGKEETISVEELADHYRQFLQVLESGIEKAVKLGDGLIPTYFTYEAVDYEVVVDEAGAPILSNYGLPKAKVKKFSVHTLPYFLEGPARWLKTLENKDQAQKVYELIRNSDLFDSKLQMYKTSVSIDKESMENGRIRAFTPGWLERESVFLHMSYKYLLAMLKSGLTEQFFTEIRTSLIPFLDPAVYGRSTLENSSFIASSVNPDPHVHGRGFVARLSGSTAEFLSMWFHMMAGQQVFRVGKEGLELKLNPSLPGWLFNEKGQISFKFLGHTDVTYHNPRRADTYGESQAMVNRIELTNVAGQTVTIQDSTIKGDMAADIREGKYNKINIFYQ